VFFNFGRKKNENLSFKNGHFLTICGHFYGNYIYIFHKTEIQTVILRCLVCLNQVYGALGELSDNRDFSLHAWDSFSQEIGDKNL
jgi:hypothetical protein